MNKGPLSILICDSRVSVKKPPKHTLPNDKDDAVSGYVDVQASEAEQDELEEEEQSLDEAALSSIKQ